MRTQPAEVLHSESRLASESRASKRVRRVLVVAEVAMSVALVLMTGLLALSLTRMMHVDRGFETERTISANVALPRNAYGKEDVRKAFMNALRRDCTSCPARPTLLSSAGHRSVVTTGST